MLKIGQMNKCRVSHFSKVGAFLQGIDTPDKVLLPQKYVPKELSEDDFIDVFIYLDSQERIISTTLPPFAQVNDFTSLKVTDTNELGAFLDWGLEKDLFLPFSEQLRQVKIGYYYPVFIYLDKKKRPTASTRIDKFIKDKPSSYNIGDPVPLLIYQKTSLGLKAVIDNKYKGVIFSDDVINHLKIGQKTMGFIKNIRPDNKIDLSLKPLKEQKPTEITQLIINQLKSHGGYLNINSKTPASKINSLFNVSRKKFKIALGALYKKRMINIDQNGIQLLQTPTQKN